MSKEQKSDSLVESNATKEEQTMPGPLSNDLRERMIAVMKNGLSCKATARQFGVAPSTAIKLKKHEDKHKTVEPLKLGGHLKHKLSQYHDNVIKLLSEKPDMTLFEFTDSLKAQGIATSYGGIYRYLKHIGMTLKKR